MERVIVTGATSMIGEALIEECLKHGISVCAVIRKDTARMQTVYRSGFPGGIRTAGSGKNRSGCAGTSDNRLRDKQTGSGKTLKTPV